VPIRRNVADAVGISVLAVLAGFVALLVAAVYGKENASWAWGLGFPVLAVCDIFLYALVSVPVGALSLAVDAVVGGSQDANLKFRDAIWHAGSPFGIVLTIAICPGLTLVCLAGAARALLVTRNDTSSTA
jgi:hypothetical protein